MSCPTHLANALRKAVKRMRVASLNPAGIRENFSDYAHTSLSSCIVFCFSCTFSRNLRWLLPGFGSTWDDWFQRCRDLVFLLHSVTHLSRIRSHQLDCSIFIRICFSISILRHVLISEIVNVLLFYPPLLLLAADRPKGTEQPPGRDSCYTGRAPKMCLVQKVSVQTILYPAGRLLATCNSYPNLGSHVSTLPAHRWVQRLLGAQRVGRPRRM